MNGTRGSVLYGEEQLRVPKVPVLVELVLDGGRRFRGILHLSPAAGCHGGRERVIELLDAPEPFLPMTVTGSGAHLLAKERIVLVQVPEPEDAGLGDIGAAAMTNVELGLATMPPDMRHLRGTMTIAMPPGRVRLLDYLNETGPFIPLQTDGGTVLVARRYIVHVSQL